MFPNTGMRAILKDGNGHSTITKNCQKCNNKGRSDILNFKKSVPQLECQQYYQSEYSGHFTIKKNCLLSQDGKNKQGGEVRHS